MLEVPLFAGVGNIVADKLAKKYNLKSKSVIIFCLCWIAVIPVWGLIGFGTDSFGIRKGWEILLLGPIYGLPLGAMQSYSRSLFASLTPKGMETQFFAFFEITDKGSSWLGPLVVTACLASSDDTDYGLRFSYVYILFMCLFPAFLLHKLDVEEVQRQAAAFTGGVASAAGAALTGIGMKDFVN